MVPLLRGPSLLAVLTLVALPLAGCVSDAPESGDGVVVVTDPRDFSYLNNTTQPGSHLHDYWNGATELFVLEDDNRGSIYGTTGSVTIASFRPPAGNLVPLGTGAVHITPTISGLGTMDDDGADVIDRHDTIELWVKTAADTGPAFFAELADGETLIFPVTDNIQNDIPHQTLSSWRFDAVMKPKEGDVTGEWRASTLALNVTAHRGLDLPLFPPHPDPWLGNDTIRIAEHTGSIDRTSLQPLGYYFGSQYHPVPTIDGGIVPHDARRVEVTIHWDEEESVAAIPGLAYHHAAGWDWIHPDPVERSDDTVRYILPVDGHGDSPYALQTVWEFMLVAEREDAAAGASSPSHRLDGDYEVVVTAHRV